MHDLFYFEVLVCRDKTQCCCLFVFGDGVRARRRVWQWVETQVGFAAVREIGGMPLMQGLRYVRQLYKAWDGSEFFVSSGALYADARPRRLFRFACCYVHYCSRLMRLYARICL